jgi:hypothetical protein
MGIRVVTSAFTVETQRLPKAFGDHVIHHGDAATAESINALHAIQCKIAAFHLLFVSCGYTYRYFWSNLDLNFWQTCQKRVVAAGVQVSNTAAP